MSSTDGYCTIATFTEGELGQPYKESKSETSESGDVKTGTETEARELIEVTEKQVLHNT